MAVYDANIPMASIYVGDLTSDVDDSLLWTIFGGYGEVLSIKVCRDVYSGASLCYAYVNYRTKPEAERAIKSTNNSIIDGKQCRVMWSIRDPNKRRTGAGNLFVKNIHSDLDSKALFEAFSAFGPVMSCKIAQDEYGSSKGFGFVQFYNENDSEDATKKVNGVEFRGKKLYVSKFIPKNARTNASKHDPSKFTNIFVKNFGDEWDLENFKQHFSKFGEITSCIIQMDTTNKSLGFGFVNFENSVDAVIATQEMNGFLLQNGSKLYVSRAMKKAERIGYLRKLREQRKREIHQQYRDQNLYVKNFDENFTDEKLRREFEKFGNIRSVQVMRDENQKSKCFGFVCFSAAAEADAAIAEMHGKLVDTKPLYVSIAQTKEERRKMIEQHRSPYASGFRQSIGFPSAMPYMFPQPHLMPYPNFQYHRNPHGGPRSGGRGSGPPQPINLNVASNPRYNYNHQSNGSYPSHYRQRGSQPNQSSGRGERYPAPSSGIRNSHNFTYQQRPFPPQTAVNQVVVETKPKREEKQVQKGKGEVLKNEFGDRLYNLCQNVFSSNQYDTVHLQKVCGAVLDYVTTAKGIGGIPPDQDLTKLVVECYKDLATTA